MEKPHEDTEKIHSSEENITKLISKLAVDYLQLVVEGARCYQNEVEQGRDIPFLLRNIKGIARANAKFLDGVASRIHIVGEVMRQNPTKWSTSESIDYEKLADMIAERLRTPKDSPDQA